MGEGTRTGKQREKGERKQRGGGWSSRPARARRAAPPTPGGLDEGPAVADEVLAGRVRGRVVVDVNA